jgi:hypothetical protein
MKLILLVFLLICYFTNFSQETKFSYRANLELSNGIGPLTLGLNLNEVKSKMGEPDTLFNNQIPRTKALPKIYLEYQNKAISFNFRCTYKYKNKQTSFSSLEVKKNANFALNGLHVKDMDTTTILTAFGKHKPHLNIYEDGYELRYAFLNSPMEVHFTFSINGEIEEIYIYGSQEYTVPN